MCLENETWKWHPWPYLMWSPCCQNVLLVLLWQIKFGLLLFLLLHFQTKSLFFCGDIKVPFQLNTKAEANVSLSFSCPTVSVVSNCEGYIFGVYQYMVEKSMQLNCTSNSCYVPLTPFFSPIMVAAMSQPQLSSILANKGTMQGQGH